TFANTHLSTPPGEMVIDGVVLMNPRWVVTALATGIAGGLIGWPAGAVVGAVVGGVLYIAAEKTLRGRAPSTTDNRRELAERLATEPPHLSAVQLTKVLADAVGNHP